ncbi:IS200/IS605 family transposase [Bradyrhizobium sp. 174]|uniref:IS200/IS605 family transposase n=1 Tax=Bradyrhizobium sp. 174 TaxID=2782645 RepID=UPI001FFB18F7|nr:IS200/IS605 family transposase [Bradyrhizobium sp. 174]MCK1571221.1 IS200/IS605 family transposase [Bradyrhizobium sp. 174]
MDDYETLSHSTWNCKYHVGFIPKCRRTTLYGELRQHLGEVFRRLAMQKESRVEEVHLMPDHVHMMLAIPPKYAVSEVIGYIKGKSAIHLARVYGERKRNFVRQHFWARGYFVSTVGRDEAVIREYIRKQETEDARLDQLNMWR